MKATNKPASIWASGLLLEEGLTGRTIVVTTTVVKPKLILGDRPPDCKDAAKRHLRVYLRAESAVGLLISSGFASRWFPLREPHHPVTKLWRGLWGWGRK